jgi:hypothetical protein
LLRNEVAGPTAIPEAGIAFPDPVRDPGPDSFGIGIACFCSAGSETGGRSLSGDGDQILLAAFRDFD